MQLAQAAPALWPFAESFLSRAVKRCGTWTLAQIAAGVADGRYLLWFAVEGDSAYGAAVTRIIAPPRTCHVIACGGQGHGQLPQLLSTIEEYARHKDCERVMIEGRRGWARVLRDYHQPYITLEKAL
jgi:hypothetical protein